MADTSESLLGRLVDVVGGMARSNERNHQDFKDYFEDRTVVGESLADFRKREKLRKQEVEYTKKELEATKNAINATIQFEVAMKKGEVAKQQATTQLIAQLDDLVEHTSQVTEAQRKDLARISDMASAGEDLTGEIQNLHELYNQIGKQQKKELDQQEILMKQRDRLKRSIIDVRENMETWAKGFFSWQSAIGLAAKGVAKSFEQLDYSLEHQVPIIDTFSGSLTDSAAMYGLSTKRLAETQNQYSQVILASAGNVSSLEDAGRKYLQTFGAMRESLRNITGDYDKASELLGASMQLISYAGTQLSFDAIKQQIEGPNGLAKNLHDLAAITNKSARELVELNSSILADREVRVGMLGLDKRQRANRLNEMLQFQKMMYARGMEIDQVMEATRALQKLTGTMDPKERYKQAAKMRAISGAMGVGGGEQAMQLSMINPQKWSDSQREFMANFATQMEQGIGEMLGSENLGAQMVGGAYQNVLQGQLFDTVRTLSTAGMEQRSIGDETLKAVTEQNNQLSGVQSTLDSIRKLTERIKAFGDDSGIFLAGAGLAALGKIAIDVSMITRYLSAKGMLDGGPGKGKGLKGALGKAGRFAGGAAGVAGAAYGGWQVGSFLNTLPEKMGFDSLSTNIGDLVDRARGNVYDPNADVPKTNKHASPSERRATSITAAAQVQDAIDKMKASDDEGQQALAKSIENNAEATKKMTELMQKGIDAQKAAIEATKENTNATKEDVKKMRYRTMEKRAPGGTAY